MRHGETVTVVGRHGRRRTGIVLAKCQRASSCPGRLQSTIRANKKKSSTHRGQGSRSDKAERERLEHQQTVAEAEAGVEYQAKFPSWRRAR